MAAGMIDVHFHLIPQFYREAVYEAGTGPAIGRYPDWTPELALALMDKHWIALAMLSLGQPGVGFLPPDKAGAFGRRCNDYSAAVSYTHLDVYKRQGHGRCREGKAIASPASPLWRA